MGFLRDAAFAAAGYGLNSLMHSEERNNTPNYNDSLKDIIDEYAHRHDIWGYNNDLYHRLLEIAERYHDPYSE